MHESLSATVAVIFLIVIASQWLAWRVKLPAIIFLLLAGILAGPLFGWLQPDALLGDFFFPFVSLSVAIILFEGSMTLKFHEIRGLRRVIRNLVTIGMLMTWGITTVATRAILGFSWEVAFLFGAVMVVTGPTVIVPMLRTVRPSANVANILRWEGILIDPIGATLAVLVFEFIVSGGGREGTGTVLLAFGKILLIGILLGAAAGQLFGIVLRRHWLPRYLYNTAALALVLAVFVASNHMEAEAGLLSVTVMGIWLANMRQVDLEEILDFKESMSLLLISILFIVLAARMEPAAFEALGWRALLVFGVIQFLARPLNVQVSAVGSRLSWAERHILAWIAPRGIVAAAITVLFALKLEALGYTQAALMVPLTFMVIIGTVVLQSATARPIATWLGVAEPEPKGFLIVGAGRLSRAIGRELTANGFRVLLADDNWDNIMDAKMEGLETYYGNAVSEHAERHLNLVGIGRVLALTPNEELNALAVKHYRMEFGPANVFAVQAKRAPKSDTGRMKSDLTRGGQTLFAVDATYAKLMSLQSGGGEIKTTRLTGTFTFDTYLGQYTPARVPLFAIDGKERLRVFTVEAEVAPSAGWKVIGLTPGEAVKRTADAEAAATAP